MIVFASLEAKYFGPHFSSTNKRRTSSSWLLGCWSPLQEEEFTPSPSLVFPISHSIANFFEFYFIIEIY